MSLTAAGAIALIKEHFHKPEGFFSFLIRTGSKEEKIARTILRSFHPHPLERWAFVQAMKREFLQKSMTPLQLDALKKAFCRECVTDNWKDALLQLNQREQSSSHFIFLKYANSLEAPLDVEARTLFSKKTSSDEKISSVFGSTFVTNRQERIDTKGHHLLDATYGRLSLDENKQFNGFALALGDGAGGHFGELIQDKRIARAAHFATKACTRLLSAYHTPEDLLRDLPSIIQAIREEVKEKGLGESTTLLACRAFPTPTGYRIVGFNIGDNLLVAWTPFTKTIALLSPSHVTEAGTALLPDAYRSFEIQFLDTLIPKESFLFLMSDGVHDLLPFTEEEKTYPNGLKYRERTLIRLDHFFADIPPHAPSDCYLKVVVKKMMQKVEELKEQAQHTPNVQIGDDFSLLLCELF